MLLLSCDFVPFGREKSDSTNAVVGRTDANIPLNTSSSGSGLELAPITTKDGP
jgi:hypothetical protein